MSALDRMRKRLEFQGGITQESRFIKDKERSLKKALLYSYQACTIVLQDDRNFRALMNPNKLKPQYDEKMISIPFKDICLNRPRAGKRSEGEEEVGLKTGDYFVWKETNTTWLVYLRYIEEDAYFRANVRRCDYEITINDTVYKVAAQGPTETTVDWVIVKHDYENKLNYTLHCMITKNADTIDFIKRHNKCMLDGKPWKIEVTNDIDADDVIQFYLKEDYTQTYPDEELVPEIVHAPEGVPAIIGPNVVYPFDEVQYQIENCTGGEWYISENGHTDKMKETSDILTLSIGRKGGREFTIIYKKQNVEIASLEVKVDYL